MPKIIEIDGIIGWDVLPSDISRALKEADGDEVEILFSSDGGYIADGLAIFNHIYDYQGKTTAKIIGMAASMASYIPLAADKVIAKSNAVFMIHDALMGIYGNAKEHEKAAKVLNGFSNMLADIYVKKTGKTKDEIRDMMLEESFFFGSEIFEAGFVDEIEEINVESDKSRDDLILDAMMRAEATFKKIQEKPENYKKIAAILKQEEDFNQRTSANQNPKQEDKMNWEDFFNMPENKAKLEALIKEAEEKGAKSVRDTVNSMKTYLESSAYASIHPECIAAILGEQDVATVKALAIFTDKQAEKEKSLAASSESEGLGDTLSGQTTIDDPAKPKGIEGMRMLADSMKNKKQPQA